MLILAPLLLFLAHVAAASDALTPSFFDIGKRKRITATATCGENYSPRQNEPGERYCKLASLNCDYCVPGEADKNHNIRNANDGSNRWWQSPPLSRGLNFRKVNITIDFDQVKIDNYFCSFSSFKKMHTIFVCHFNFMN